MVKTHGLLVKQTVVFLFQKVKSALHHTGCRKLPDKAKEGLKTPRKSSLCVLKFQPGHALHPASAPFAHRDAPAPLPDTKPGRFVATIPDMKTPIARALIGATLLGLASLASAQSTPATPVSSPVKKELIARLLKLQQPGLEGLARQVAEQPAAQMLNQAGAVLSARVAPDKQEAVANQIQADAKKYADEAVPVVRASALKLAPSTVGAVLDKAFTEDELKQIVAIQETLDSPAYVKYRSKSDEMQNALLEKLIPDTKGAIEPKVRALEQTIGKRLGITDAPAAAPAKPAAAK